MAAEGWAERSLGEVATVDPEALTSSTRPDEVLDYISLEDVSQGALLGSSRIPFREAPSRARRILREDDVLFGTVRPNLQSHLLYEGGLVRPVASTGFTVIRAIPGRADPRFLFEFVMSHLAGDQVSRIIAGSNYPAVSSGDVRRLRIDLPPFDEQVAIGSALADAGSAVAALKRLIAKKEAIGRGMMQRLLRPREDGADTVRLGSVTSWSSGGTPSRANPAYWSGTIPWISATTIRQLEVFNSEQLVTPAAVKAGSRMAPLDSTLLLVRGSALHSEVRASLVTGPVCFNQDLKALVPSPRLVPKFLTYSIHGNAPRLLRLVTSAGNTAGVLETQVLKRFEIWLPSPAEQERIVTVLDDVEEDIGALRLRLSKAIGIKRAMVQELLSGRTRLPLMEAVAA